MQPDTPSYAQNALERTARLFASARLAARYTRFAQRICPDAIVEAAVVGGIGE